MGKVKEMSLATDITECVENYTHIKDTFPLACLTEGNAAKTGTGDLYKHRLTPVFVAKDGQ